MDGWIVIAREKKTISTSGKKGEVIQPPKMILPSPPPPTATIPEKVDDVRDAYLVIGRALGG